MELRCEPDPLAPGPGADCSAFLGPSHRPMRHAEPLSDFVLCSARPRPWQALIDSRPLLPRARAAGLARAAQADGEAVKRRRLFAGGRAGFTSGGVVSFISSHVRSHVLTDRRQQALLPPRPAGALRPLCLLPAVRGHWAHHSPRPGRAGPARELHRREPHAASPGRGHQDGAPAPRMLSRRPRRPPWAELPLWAQGQVLPRPGGAGHRAGAPGKPPPHTPAPRPGDPPPTPRLGRGPGPRQAHMRLTSLHGVQLGPPPGARGSSGSRKETK